MDALVMGALSSLILKLGNVLVGEYKLQKGVKGQIMFLQSELESMQGALKEIADVPADQVDNQDKIWAGKVRELSYDIEDSIDTFLVRCNDHGEPQPPARPYAHMKAFIERSLDLLTRFHIRRNIATEIRGIKRRLVEVHERRMVYKLDGVVNKHAIVDPRLLAHYTKVTDLVGIDNTRHELIECLMREGHDVSTKKGKIISIVGFGGLGKTTLANVVYVKIKEQFDFCAFVSVSQNPDMKKLFKDLLRNLGKNVEEEYTLDEKSLIDRLRAFLKEKRYFIIIDDIWDITIWKMIRCALPDNRCGYRIITTTRIYDVAEQVGGVYQMKPLSPRNSKILLCSRIFGSEDKGNNVKCPDEQLDEVSDKILKKCAGVPLAIITIASLLAGKGTNKIKWFEVCNSIGVGLENNLDVKNMRKILSFSYYDLPSYLRKCLLYLSVFPEDYEIDKNRLIWMWIAEDFIECGKHGGILFEIGESYFNELINKGMIQPIYGGYSEHTSAVTSCRIHDMILDLVRSLSNEQNFVTISDDVDRTSPSRMIIRRICYQNKKEDRVTSETTVSVQQVRSVIVFPPAINLVPSLWNFSVLRVLDLDNCNLSQAYSLEYLGNLFHLRYLGLRDTMITQLPEEIGNLRFLQTLNIRFNPIISLPTTIVQLRHLLCLLFDGSQVKRIDRLTSLEELSLLTIRDNGATGTIKELGNLKKLRVLAMLWNTEWNDSLEKSMVECLNRLQNIRCLNIYSSSAGGCKCNLDGWATPPHLSRLQIGFWFSTLPDWMNPPSLQDLWCLQIWVRELRQEDLQILGRLPALHYLDLKADHENLGITWRFTVSACSFPCLLECRLSGFGGPVEFQQGSMPRLTNLSFSSPVCEAREITGSDGSLNFGLGNLHSLHSLVVRLNSRSTSKEVEELKAAVVHAMEIHPNHPSFWMYIDGKKAPGGHSTIAPRPKTHLGRPRSSGGRSDHGGNLWFHDILRTGSLHDQAAANRNK
ncbi:hypothetical protein U9M48_005518 [Paspalum notatum var. saurae]|uniref:Uncharacterized protein n=1 Tax=Paspalum notatum var. saurae TaxID=547442 RepID=A0AAQ3PXW0_PASNO